MRKDNLIINISISILVAIGFFFIYKTSSDVLNSEYKPKSIIASSNYVELHPMIVESEANSVPSLNRVVKKSSNINKKVLENSIEMGTNGGGIYEGEEEYGIEVVSDESNNDSVVIETTVKTITTSIERFVSGEDFESNEKDSSKKPVATTIRGGNPFTITPLNDTSKGVILSKDPTADKTPVVVAQVDIPTTTKIVPATTVTDYQASSSTYLTGRAIDGYLKNAIVCLDLNGDGYCKISEEPSTNTDENGSYKLTITKAHREHKNFEKAMVIVFDGIDVDTGKRFEGKLVSVQSDNGNINLSPITTLVAKKVEMAIVANEDISTNQIQDQIQDAQRKVARLLDIDEKDIGEDPVFLHENGDSELLQKSLQLQKSVETLVITAKKESSLDTATITENIYEALAGSLDHAQEVVVSENKEGVEQSPKSKNDTNKKPIALIVDKKKENDGISILLDKTQKMALHDEGVKDLLGGDKSVEMVSVAKQMSENVKTAFQEIDSDQPEEERHIVALSVSKDLQEVKKSLKRVVDIDQIGDRILITPNDNRFEDKDWGRKYIEDDLLALGIPCLDCSSGLVSDLKELLLSENESIKPGMLLEGSDELLSSSKDLEIQDVYKLVLKKRNSDLKAKNALLNSSLQVSVDIVDEDSADETQSSVLSRLIFSNTYYAVEDGRENLLKVSFDTPSIGEVKVEELSGKQRLITSQYSVEDTHLRVPINNYDFVFISEEEDYLLFEDGRRMYYSFEKAKEFIESFITSEEQLSSELIGLLKSGLYYAVEDGRGDLLEVSFDDPDDGLVTIQELSGDQRLITVPYTIENNRLTTPINEYTFTFIEHKGSYLSFEDGRRMYYSEEEARSFIEEFDTPMF